MLAADQLGQIFRLLLLIGPAADLIDAEVRVGAVAKAHRGGRAGDFFLSDDMLEVAEPEPAPFFLDRDSVEAECAHFGPELARELVRLVDLGGDRRDPVPGKTLGRLADRVRHFAKLKIQAHICHRGLLTNGRVAPANGFEQATAQSYVQCNRNPPSP